MTAFGGVKREMGRKCIASRGSSYVILCLECYLPKVFEELEVKQSVVVNHDKVTHPLLSQ